MACRFGSGVPDGDATVGGSLSPFGASSSPSGSPSPSTSATAVLKITAAAARQACGLEPAVTLVVAVSPNVLLAVPGINWLTSYDGFAHDRSDERLVCGNGSATETTLPLKLTCSV